MEQLPSKLFFSTLIHLISIMSNLPSHVSSLSTMLVISSDCWLHAKDTKVLNNKIKDLPFFLLAVKKVRKNQHSQEVTFLYWCSGHFWSLLLLLGCLTIQKYRSDQFLLFLFYGVCLVFATAHIIFSYEFSFASMKSFLVPNSFYWQYQS